MAVPVMTLERPAVPPVARRIGPFLRLRGPEALVFVVALGVRLATVARSAGFRASYGYDQSVYYNAAASLLHGRVPYRYSDFVLLHPPVVMLALLPAALVGHLTTDRTGFLAANLGFTVLAAVNAVLVLLIARRLRLRPAAALAGGLFYAVWFAAVNAEYSARLEPLGNTALLLAALILTTALDDRTDGRRRTRLLLIAGALFGVAASVKIWFAVPVVVAVGWLWFAERRPRAAGGVALGALVAGVVIDGPFLLMSRGQMWSMVVTAQLGRASDSIGPRDRLTQLTSTYWADPHLAAAPLDALTVAAIVLLLLVLVQAWRYRPARWFVVVGAANALTLLLSPGWFGQYADFVAAPVAICVAVAVHRAPQRWRLTAWLPLPCAAAITAAVLVQANFPATGPWGPTHHLAVAARSLRCVMSDSPEGLIELNVLDRDLSHGCANWVDVTGRSYLGADRGPLPRTSNARWQRDLVDYLRSGQAIYPSLFGQQRTAATRAEIMRDGVLASVGRYRLYRVTH